MPDLPAFVIHLTPTDMTVSVDGKDISAAVSGVQVTKTDRFQMPVITLDLFTDAAAVDVTGLAVKPSVPVEDFLASLDAEELEQETLAIGSYGEKPTQTLLRLLQAKARAS